VEAEKSLVELLASPRIEERIAALPIYVDMQMQTQQYPEAAKAIEEGLSLPLPTDLSGSLGRKLDICKQEISKKQITPDCEAKAIKEFILSIPSFLSQGFTGSKHPFIEASSFSDVSTLAHNQNISRPYYSWNAARTSASKEIYTHCFKNKVDLTEFDYSSVRKIKESCTKTITEGHPGYNFFDDIEADITMISRGLLVGKLPDLLRKMKAAYEMHLFPCGWKGSFPSGELVVYRLW
jgi:hypothetical protein